MKRLATAVLAVAVSLGSIVACQDTADAQVSANRRGMCPAGYVRYRSETRHLRIGPVAIPFAQVNTCRRR